MMYNSKKNLIKKKTDIIAIPQPTPLAQVASFDNTSIQSNCFDPTKSSPPNSFMQKLQTRMNSYENGTFSTK